ncbi:segregation/condensation protein A [Amphibacillus jilinensis]|uniref:segregation/condensation protein A n=1 Tax=Amphibacillus jilinensis TaxID=1216008 RepID=UPI0002FE7886|nr:segregation/condensation protein A [Amphibacillus jilinensis]
MLESYSVSVEGFEGPLDLLLHLINRYEIDIYNIPVAKISEQYMQYIHTMQQLELNIASEYLVMAATLLAIKSAMLLPNQEIEADDNYEGEDPRDELIARLIEYRKYKEAAQTLQELEGEEKESFTRPPQKWTEDKKLVSKPKKGAVTVYDMLSAMQNVFDRKKWNRPMTTTIEKIEIPIKQRMEEVLSQIETAKQGIPFDQLFPYPSKSHMVITFMAVLELMKDKLIFCEQERTFDSLIIHRWRG